MAITTDITPTNQSFALFEGSSIKQFIIEQLNAGGIFIDQQYIGSNLNAFIDIIAVMLQQLQFHYNTTASESTFATASLYENMNKLVSLFNYKPTGKQTSILPIKIDCKLSNINKLGTYIIPRYSFINYNKSFILRNDLTFSTIKDEISTINDIFYQGTINESPIFNTSGEDFQIITLADQNITTNNGKFITDNFFDVYIREPNSKWTQFQEINSLFDSKGNDKVFERRINENYSYEFKFGNNINGYKPKENSEVIIFYVVSDGSIAQVGDNLIKDTELYLYNSSKFNEIIKDNVSSIFEIQPAYILPEDLKYFTVSNSGYSTPVSDVESVDIIRNNVPKIFAAQNRLLTEQDYITFINKLFSNFIKDCYVFSNLEYTSSYLKYFYDIGLKAPNDDPRVALNQVTFQSSCGFNNVYVTLLPLINTIIEDKIPNYVNTNLKQYVVDQLTVNKDIAHNIAPIDPIYKAISFGVVKDTENTLPKHFDNVKLVLVRDKYSNFNSDYIVSQANTLFKSYFDNVKLGSLINISALSAALAQIPGIVDIRMSDGTNVTNKLTFIIWNPLYESDDFIVTQQNTLLSPFMYQYFYDLKNINSKIEVINE